MMAQQYTLRLTAPCHDLLLTQEGNEVQKVEKKRPKVDLEGRTSRRSTRRGSCTAYALSSLPRRHHHHNHQSQWFISMHSNCWEEAAPVRSSKLSQNCTAESASEITLFCLGGAVKSGDKIERIYSLKTSKYIDIGANTLQDASNFPLDLVVSRPDYSPGIDKISPARTTRQAKLRLAENIVIVIDDSDDDFKAANPRGKALPSRLPVTPSLTRLLRCCAMTWS